MPKFSVIRLAKSNETSNCEAGGTSAVLDQATVGMDISSATQGSSVASVAGRKRAPTKQWARASVVDSAAVRLASASVYSKCRDIGIFRSEHVNVAYSGGRGCISSHVKRRASRAGGRIFGRRRQI